MMSIDMRAGRRYLAMGAAMSAVVAATLAGAAPHAYAETAPTAPGSIRVTEIGLDTVKVTFTDRSTNEHGFDIQRRQAPSGTTYTTVKSIRDHSSGQPGSTGKVYSSTVSWPPVGYHCYRVKAFNDAGAGNSFEVCPPKSDLVITRITLSPSPPVYAQPFTTTLTVCNEGGSPSGSFLTRTQLDGDLTAEAAMSSIAPDSCGTRALSWQGVGVGGHTLVANADLPDRVPESDETNNSRTRTWLTTTP